MYVYYWTFLYPELTTELRSVYNGQSSSNQLMKYVDFFRIFIVLIMKENLQTSSECI